VSQLNDTIVAIATPPGQGAIGIIRFSGHDAIQIVDKYFYGKNLNNVEGNTVHYGKIKDEKDQMLDECMASVFKAPRSYTKENSVELMRAFLNGQLDLSQAEAVADLIASENASTHDLALKQLRGGFSDVIKTLRQELIDFSALIELELDFGEEDVEFADRTKLETLVKKIQTVMQQLIQSFQYGNVIKNGVSTVIAGRPNAGKSTLLNALLNEERAIVSDIAGTTRDTIEESLNIKGIKFRLIDTAGIRQAQDAIEKIGVEKTREKINTSTLIVYVFDVTESKPEDVWEDIDAFLQSNADLQAGNKKLFVANKMDLNPYTKLENYYKQDLINHNANQSLSKVLDGLNTGLSPDLVAMDIRQSLYSLGEITGEISTDDLLESIFSRFCIGK